MTEVKIKNTYDKKLKKEYSIVIPNEIVVKKVDTYLAKIAPDLNLKGFRKGKVPVAVVKEKYGKSVRSEEVENIINDNVRKIVSDNNLKLALRPKLDVKSLEEGKDLELNVTMELLPEIPEVDLAKIKVIKREAEISNADIEESVNKLLKYYRKWNQADAAYKAKNGDAVNIDYVGKIDKVEFEGGAAKAQQLELGSKSFIDDFEDQLVGKKAGDEVKVKVKFPKEYHKAEYAGKAAEFEVKVNHVLTATMPEITDEFLKNSFGLENKAALDEAIKKQVESSYKNMARSLFKKELFDFLNKKYDFDLPQGLVDQQTEGLWAEVEEELKTNPNKFKSDKEKNKAKEEKEEIAQRMIRCGMILSDIATKNKISASDEDINREIGKVLTQFNGREKEVIEFYRKNPHALDQVKGSILEEKTVDFILTQPDLESKAITTKELDKLWNKVMEE